MTEKRIQTLRERLRVNLILTPTVNWIRTQKVKTTRMPMDLRKDWPRVKHSVRHSVRPKGWRILIQKES